MNCPHCDNDIDYVFCVCYFAQRQSLNENGELLDEWSDVNDAIGDTLYYECPKCLEKLIFDHLGKLVK